MSHKCAASHRPLDWPRTSLRQQPGGFGPALHFLLGGLDRVVCAIYSPWRRRTRARGDSWRSANWSSFTDLRKRRCRRHASARRSQAQQEHIRSTVLHRSPRRPHRRAGGTLPVELWSNPVEDVDRSFQRSVHAGAPPLRRAVFVVNGRRSANPYLPSLLTQAGADTSNVQKQGKGILIRAEFSKQGALAG
jgi:hypothetical protein